MTDEEFDAAKADLERAIKAFYALRNPDSYVGDWVLIVHRETRDTHLVSTVAATGQSFHRTTGLIIEASKQ